MTEETSPDVTVGALSVAAARLNGVVNEASAASLFSKVAVIEACRQNPFQPSLVWHPSAFGGFMQLDLRERVSQEIFLVGAFEPDLLWFFSCALSSGMTVFDCGAHIGFFSLAAGYLVGPTGSVAAFEPVASTKAHLDTNIRNAGFSHVVTHGLAVWDGPGTIEIRDLGHAMSAFNSIMPPRLAPGTAAPPETKLRVPAISLDSFVAASGRMPDLVKIDVESAEFQVVTGMSGILRDGRPLVTVEVGDFAEAVAAGVRPSRDTLHRLAEAEYTLFELKNCRLLPHVIAESESYGYGNIVAVPAEKVDALLARTAS